MKISLKVVGDGCLAPGSQQNSSVTLLDSSRLFASDDLCQAENKLNAGSEELEELSNGKKKRGGANAIRAPHVNRLNVECQEAFNRFSKGFSLNV